MGSLSEEDCGRCWILERSLWSHMSSKSTWFSFSQ